MSYILGPGNNPMMVFTLYPGHKTRIWWYGIGGGFGYNVGFAFPSPVWFVSNRVVVDTNAMDYLDTLPSGGVFYTVDLHTEDPRNTGEAGIFRIEIGGLS
jgi:hypothetical protein